MFSLSVWFNDGVKAGLFDSYLSAGKAFQGCDPRTTMDSASKGVTFPLSSIKLMGKSSGKTPISKRGMLLMDKKPMLGGFAD